ncbi:hypothetical protein [Streptomyces sp. SUK 48]|uniref:hypothetical protein n=1 Tax=Streptomyces sp. SUK 48 TaxID=2582831 RepID=UPI00129AB93E|nr:hypothetical protein [Streptomyces sp. SUK 48]
MSSPVEILLAVGIVVLVLLRQWRGDAVHARKLIVLPAALTVAGSLSLASAGRQPTGADTGCLVVGGLLAAVIGAGQGRAVRLEHRGGALWARMPVAGLWWWAALIASRLVMTGLAHALDAGVAASSSSVLLLLGVNRVGQALVLVPRALAAGVSLAPDRGETPVPGGARGLVRRYGNRPPVPAGAAGEPSRNISRTNRRAGRIVRAASERTGTVSGPAAPGADTTARSGARPRAGNLARRAERDARRARRDRRR